MASDSRIEWTDATWPLTTGCDDESPGCLNCYSKAHSHRLAGNPNADISGPYAGTTERRDGGPIRWTGNLNLLPERLDWPLGWRKPRRIFVGNMSDLFHPAVPFDFIDHAFAAMAVSSWHTFQVLTKRAGRMAEYFSDPSLGRRLYAIVTAWLDEGAGGFLGRHWDRAHDLAGVSTEGVPTFDTTRWRLPVPNVWLGVSVEDQKRADERIPRLLETPAVVRFLSMEPLLGPVDLGHRHEWQPDGCGPFTAYGADGFRIAREQGRGIDWVIVGGESGPNARPMHPDWARSIRDQCQAAGVPFFFKQHGEWVGSDHPVAASWPKRHEEMRWAGKVHVWPYKKPSGPPHFGMDFSLKVGKKAAGRTLDGRTWDQLPGVAGASR